MLIGDIIKSDDAKLVLEASKDGKVRVTSSSLHDAAVMLPGQVLQLRLAEGKIVIALRDQSGQFKRDAAAMAALDAANKALATVADNWGVLDPGTAKDALSKIRAALAEFD